MPKGNRSRIKSKNKDPRSQRQASDSFTRCRGQYLLILLLGLGVAFSVFADQKYIVISTPEAISRMFNGTKSSVSSSRRNSEPLSVLQLEDQEVLDRLGKGGQWVPRNTHAIERDTLGSLTRFSSCRAFLGPKFELEDHMISENDLIELGKQAANHTTPDQQHVALATKILQLSAPHSQLATASQNNMNCSEVDWVYSVEGSSIPQALAWISQAQVQAALKGRWIALWGDSTSRLLFSALVHLLQGSIESYKIPTHDFGHGIHFKKFDRCLERTNCNMAIYLNDMDCMITFRFVTRIDTWPNFKATMEQYSSLNMEFSKANYTKRFPDVVLMNNGPWEFYSYNGGTSWTDDSANQYRQALSQWLTSNFHADQAAKLIVMGNTACPQDAQCEASGGFSCVDAMTKIATIQESILEEVALPSIRYVPPYLPKSLPTGYNCKNEGYHVPGVMTDARLNLALKALAL